MLSREQVKDAKVLEIRRLIEEEIPPERASKMKIDVRLDKGGLCKVWIRSKLIKTRTSEGLPPTAT